MLLGAILHLVLLILSSACERRPRKASARGPQYMVTDSTILPSDTQVTVILNYGIPKLLTYNSEIDHGDLTATLTTCGSPIRWNLDFSRTNQSRQLVTDSMNSLSFPVKRGMYFLKLESLDKDTLVHIYISTEPGGPQALESSKIQNFRLLKRQKRKHLTVKWNLSQVDPQGTDYCLVVSTKKHYHSLCSAQLTAGGIHNPTITQFKALTTYKSAKTIQSHPEPVVICVGRKSQYTLTDLQKGRQYFFDLFAINRQTNFTYPFGTTSIKFDGKTKPLSLKDGEVKSANLKELDGKAVFRYKVGKKAGKSLDLFVVPCGGAVEVEIMTKEKTVMTLKRIEGFGNISIPNPERFTRYYIKVFALNREELKKTSRIEVYATTKSLAKIPLPSMPDEVRVEEYASLKTCKSVTVGWIPAPNYKTTYCLLVKEGRIRESDEYRMPNQCSLESRLKKSANPVIKLCKNVQNSTKHVMVETIKRLKPGRNYIVQVTVKKPKGKTLSYDLLQVYTKSSCSKRN